MNIDINSLKEHPLNKEIYGDDDIDQLNDLVQKIKESGWIKPIIVTKLDYIILSGHRRYRAAKQLGMKEIEVDIYSGEEGKELELLLNENAFREKTTLQKVREAEMYRGIEQKKAEERQFLGIPLPANVQQGETNEILAEKAGMSSRSYHDARKVVQKIDEQKDEILKYFFSDTLNTSVNAAAKLVDKPDDFLHMVFEKTNGDAKKVNAVVQELEKDEIKTKIVMPVGYYQVIYVDFTVPISDDYSNRVICSLGEKDSVLLLWVLPKSLEEALGVIRNWGFKYQTCMVWNKDFCDEVSGDSEILLISTKGNPPMMFGNPDNTGKTEKPRKVRDLIEKIYTGTKLELLPDGWVVWS